MSKSKRCEICEIRPVQSASSARERGTNFPYCDPCQDKVEWENRHDDNGHATLAETPEGEIPWDWEIPGDVQEFFAAMRLEMSECWVCHPEKDRTSELYVERSGTSRREMRRTVSPQQGPKEKASVIAKATRAAKGTAKVITTKEGVRVTVKLGSLSGELSWDLAGRYLYGSASTLGGRRVRNVSEALRILESASA